MMKLLVGMTLIDVIAMKANERRSVIVHPAN
jgi:hypothetical protein